MTTPVRKTPLFRVAIQRVASERLDVLAEDAAKGGTPNRAGTMSALINAAWEARESEIAECREMIRAAAGHVKRSRARQLEADRAAQKARARLRELRAEAEPEPRT